MPKKAKTKKETIVFNPVLGISPTEEYLRFMNDQKNARQFYPNLFQALKSEELEHFLAKLLNGKAPLTILAINSFTAENVDVVIAETQKKRKNESTHDLTVGVSSFLAKRQGLVHPQVNTRGIVLENKHEIYFTNFDEMALEMHRERAEFLKADNVHAIFDDIRASRLRAESFDILINDFRLNFNQDNKQNVATMREMFRVGKTGALSLVSVVVDCRYDSERFGKDQERAPTNQNAPWTFVGREGLERKCFTVQYYLKLFKDAGWAVVAEFDVKAGKAWKDVEQADPKKAISFRRFLLQKELRA